MRVDSRDQRVILHRWARSPRASAFGLLRLLALMVMLALSGVRAGAQSVEGDDPFDGERQARVARELERFGLSLVSIDRGLTGDLVAERWNPLRLNFINGPEPIEGIVRLTFAQDQTQRAEIQVPIIARANARVSVTAMINPPGMLSEIDVTVLRENARPYTAKIESYSDGPLSMGRIQAEASPRIAVLPGSRSNWAISTERVFPIPEAAGSQAGTPDADWSRRSNVIRDATPTSATLRSSDVPTSGMGLDGLWLLIVDADQAEVLDEPRLRAIREWVLTGGRLIVVADAPGENWMRWLPRDVASGIAIDQPRRAPTPGGVLGTMSGGEESVARGNESLPQRTIRLLGSSRAVSPWTTSLAVGGDGFLMASGPAGLGAVTLLGFDPARAPAVVDAAASDRLWKHAAGSIIDRQAPADHDRSWAMSSTSTEQAFLRDTIERISRVPEVGAAPFVAVGVIFVGLIIMLGPVDYLLLGRLKRRQWSLATAALWITIAGAVATIVPSLLIRTDQTLSDRAEFIDAILPGGDAPGLGVRSGITAVFSNASQRAGVENYPAGAWVHGVSPGLFYGNSSMLTPAATFTQRLGVVGTAVPAWGIAMPEPATGENPRTDSDRPGVLPARAFTQLRQWSLRCFVDRGVVPAPRGSIVREGEYLVARLSGFPAGTRFAGATIFVDGRVAGIASAPDQVLIDDRGNATMKFPAPAPSTPRIDRRDIGLALNSEGLGVTSATSWALERYAETPGWALVRLIAETMPADDATPSILRGANARVVREYRLAIPIGVNVPRGDQP